jgi:serine/threonine-protein kinase
MAVVRDAWDVRLGRAVAVKLLHPTMSVQDEDRRRFEAEARAAAALNHPHIVSIHDFGEHLGSPYIVMERLPGQTLADAIAAGPVDPARLRLILDDVLSALGAAHAAGILHRDIKPGNVLFTDSGGVKLADFGIAKSTDVVHTHSGEVIGTDAYLTADRLAGQPATVRDDLYAIGVVGYEALAGHKPYPQRTLPMLVRAILDSSPPPLSAVRPDLDPVLVGVIERAMSSDPRAYFADAGAMRLALAGPGPVALTRAAPATRPPRAAAAPKPSTRVLAAGLPEPQTTLLAVPRRLSWRGPLIALGVATIAIGAAIAAVTMTSQPSVPAPTTSTTAPPAPLIAPPVLTTPAQTPREDDENDDEPSSAPPEPDHHRLPRPWKHHPVRLLPQFMTPGAGAP